MDIKTIDSNYFVSEQILESDLEQIKEKGIRSIICNRPDGEGADQPGHIEIESKAKELGIDFRYVPIAQGMVQDDDVHSFKKN
jgi:sulfide:quinone oxidoreductase